VTWAHQLPNHLTLPIVAMTPIVVTRDNVYQWGTYTSLLGETMNRTHKPTCLSMWFCCNKVLIDKENASPFTFGVSKTLSGEQQKIVEN
jgi:hypothetical protein